MISIILLESMSSLDDFIHITTNLLGVTIGVVLGVTITTTRTHSKETKPFYNVFWVAKHAKTMTRALFCMA